MTSLKAVWNLDIKVPAANSEMTDFWRKGVVLYSSFLCYSFYIFFHVKYPFVHSILRKLSSPGIYIIWIKTSVFLFFRVIKYEARWHLWVSIKNVIDSFKTNFNVLANQAISTCVWINQKKFKASLMEYVFSETACMMMDFIPNLFTRFWDRKEHFVQHQT